MQGCPEIQINYALSYHSETMAATNSRIRSAMLLEQQLAESFNKKCINDSEQSSLHSESDSENSTIGH